jgi:hypothetical protein
MSQPDLAGAAPQRRVRYGSGSWIVGPIFFGLALWFLFGPDLAAFPVEPVDRISKELITPKPRRAILGDPPKIEINGFERTCMDCHRTFLTAEPKSQGLAQHQHVVVAHGPNKECMDCHDYRDRDKLLLPEGGTVAFNLVDQVCAGCHADIHLDWRRGIHGKVLGSWKKDAEARRKFECTECHDPHLPRHPAMAALRPLPGPNTLRMGEHDPEHEDEVHHERDPLRRALQHYRELEEGKQK